MSAAIRWLDEQPDIVKSYVRTLLAEEREAFVRDMREALIPLETAKARLEGESVRSIVAERAFGDVDEAICMLECMIERRTAKGGA